jgi:lipoate-protein ligase A
MNIFELNNALQNWNPEIEEVFAEDIADYISTGKEGLYFIKHSNNRLYVYRGNTEIDTEYCDLNNMTIYDLHYGGGPLIGSDRDLSFGFILPEQFDSFLFGFKILDILANLLKSKGLDAKVHGNDILVNGRKVCGTFSKKVGNRYVWCAQISFRSYAKHITKLCPKSLKSTKIPSYIPSDIITKDELKESIINAFTKKRA